MNVCVKFQANEHCFYIDYIDWDTFSLFCRQHDSLNTSTVFWFLQNIITATLNPCSKASIVKLEAMIMTDSNNVEFR